MTTNEATGQPWTVSLPNLTRAQVFAWAIPLVPMWLSILVLGVALLPEITVPVPSLNDDAAHYSLILNASRAIDAGLNPVDHWAPDLEIGYPQFAYYQHLPHLFVVVLDRLLLRQVELLTLFNLTRYALLVGFPLTVYWSLRQFEFSRPAAAAAAAVAPLLSAGHKFGFEYDSYVWRGFGMYTQLWAMHLSFLSLACIHRTLRDSKGYFASVAVLSALVLSHVIYAFIVAITLGFVLVAGMSRANARDRIVRLALIGLPAIVVTSYFWLPFVLNGAYHTTSPYMEDWKYDSFGARTILEWLYKGELMDFDRIPVVTGFAAIGVLVALWTRTRLALLALAICAFWLVAYFGRPTLGPIADLLSFNGKLWMHRYIGPMQLGAIMLVAVAAGGVWTCLHRFRRIRWPAVIFVALVLAVTVTALFERWSYLDKNTQWMHDTQQALDNDAELHELISVIKDLPPGRVYAGVRSGYSDDIKVGSLRIPDVLTFYQVETAAPPYQSLSLNSDLVWHFDYNNLAHYQILNARYVIFPADLQAPGFLTPIAAGARYQLLEAPTGGYIGLAETPTGFEGAEEDYHIVSRAWFLSSLPAKGIYPALAIPGAPKLDGLPYDPLHGASSRLERLGANHEPGALGVIESESDGKFSYAATVRVDQAATLFLKATFHPDWHVYVNGAEVEPFMLAPSFPAIHLEPGTYQVEFVYKANAMRTPLLALGILTLGLVGVADRKRDWVRSRFTGTQPRTTAAPSSTPVALTSTVTAPQLQLPHIEGIEAIVAIVLWKLGTFATAYLAWAIIPFNHPLYEANYRYGDRIPQSFAASFNTWDSQHYIKLAEQGYQAGSLSNAFGPLYPLLIRAANLVTGDSIVSGLLIANLASGVALYLLYRLVARHWNRDVAFAALLLTMAFPTAFFFNLVYTEALFLLLSVVLFYALYERRLWLAAAAAFLLPILRVPGLIAIVPLLWVLGGDALRLSFDGLRPRFRGIRWHRELLFVLAPIAGFVAYLVYMHIVLGNAFVAMDAEKLYISNRSIEHVLRPDHLLADLFRSHYSVHGYLDSATDRIFFGVFVLSLPLVYRRVDKPMFIFCLILGMQPFLGSFMSYTRLVLVAFPLYIAYAATFAPRHPYLTYAVAYPLLLLQAVLLTMQLTSNWVA